MENHKLNSTRVGRQLIFEKAKQYPSYLKIDLIDLPIHLASFWLTANYLKTLALKL